MTDKKHLVLGVGQIGTAIRDIVDADYLDIDPEKSKYEEKQYEVLHVCFSYSDKFEELVKEYQKRFSPDLTIVHSTVPVGTCDKLPAVHSPVRGIHPHLEEGIRTFVKCFGGKDSDKAAKIFKDLGLKTKAVESAKSVEAMKLWDTTTYGWNIMLEKIIYEYCQKNDLDFDTVYTDENKTYNEGYEKLGHPEYKKYILKHVDGKIGGHCVVNNLDLLDSEVSAIIKKYNDKL